MRVKESAMGRITVSSVALVAMLAATGSASLSGQAPGAQAPAGGWC